MTRKALGRGLSALIREVETATAGLEQVPVGIIQPNPLQPRRSLPEGSLQELAESIRSSGIVQPVLVRRVNGGFQLIVGERRWRAAQLAGLESIPAIVRDLDDREALELALTENLLREDLNPLDVARGFDKLQQEYRLTHEEIARRVGVSRSTVTNTLRLLRLPSSVQKMLLEGVITYGHARALLGLDSEAAQANLARLVKQSGLSVRQIENMVALGGQKAERRKPISAPAKIDANTKAAILNLERVLGTRVKLLGTEKRGKIEISYFSPEDLDRIYRLIVG